jgi:spore germination cell wall hydrolase CwlJ-like protein
MKRYQAIFIATVVATLIYYNYSINNTVAEIQETIESTNEIVKDIQVTLENTPYGLENDYHCLASNIYWEARNQSLGGKLAVGQVVLNRVDNTRFPDTICKVVKQTKYYPSGGIDLHDCQFSWYCDGLSDVPFEHEMTIYEESFELAVNLLESRPIDVTEGATHYHNNKVNPYWADSLKRITRIDDHIFYRRK